MLNSEYSCRRLLRQLWPHC